MISDEIRKNQFIWRLYYGTSNILMIDLKEKAHYIVCIFIKYKTHPAHQRLEGQPILHQKLVHSSSGLKEGQSIH